MALGGGTGEISFDHRVASEAAATYRRVAASLEGAVAALAGDVARLGQWQGQARRAFDEPFARTSADARRLAAELRARARRIEQASSLAAAHNRAVRQALAQTVVGSQAPMAW